MAVEARHLNFFPPQLLPTTREIVNPIEVISTNMYNNPQMMGYGLPLSGTTTTTGDTTLLPMHSSVITDSIPPLQKTPIKSESGLTSYNHQLPPVTRKRPRDSILVDNSLLISNGVKANSCSSFTFLGQDLSLQIQQQQYDIDHLVSHHMEKVKMEIEDKRKRQARRIMEAIAEGVARRIKAKDEELDKIGKLNLALEERVKSLCIENQIWRDLAQTNEATANALRSNLQQVLAAQVKEEHNTRVEGTYEEATAAAEIDDAQSCCGSSGDQWERLTLGNDNAGAVATSSHNNGRLLCRSCGKEESCVLLLPCRHLCLCTVCGSTLHTCPVCKATKNGSLHVNMS